jgi:hypothetical protein
MEWISRGILSLALLGLAALETRADSVSFDFHAGVGPGFSIINEGGFWSAGVQAGELRISKGPDAGTPGASFEEAQFTRGGVRSVFQVAGDFEVTVDFMLYDFPLPPAAHGLTESILGMGNAQDPTNFFWILRFNNFLESFYQFPQAALGARPSTQMRGRYRITRVGGTLTGWIAAAGSSTFVAIGSHTGFSGPAFVDLLGRQGTPFFHPPGPRGPIDIGFDNLHIEADAVDGAVPEPAILLPFAACLLGIALARRRRVRLGPKA